MELAAFKSIDQLIKIESKDHAFVELVKANFTSLSYSDELGFDSDRVDILIKNEGNEIGLIKRGVEFQLHISDGLSFFNKGWFIVDESSVDLIDQNLSFTAKPPNFINQAKVAITSSYNSSLSEILQQISDRNNWGLAIDDRLSNIAVPYLIQHNESDLSFIRKLGRLYGAIATIKNNTLIFTDNDSEKTPNDNILNQFTFSLEGADNASYQENGRDYYSGVIATYTIEANEESAFVTRNNIEMGESSTPYHISDVFNSKEQAFEAAQAEMSRINGNNNKLELTYDNSKVRVFAGSIAKLDGDFPPEVRHQKWKVARVNINVGASAPSVSLTLKQYGSFDKSYPSSGESYFSSDATEVENTYAGSGLAWQSDGSVRVWFFYYSTDDDIYDWSSVEEKDGVDKNELSRKDHISLATVNEVSFVKSYSSLLNKISVHINFTVENGWTGEKHHNQTMSLSIDLYSVIRDNPTYNNIDRAYYANYNENNPRFGHRYVIKKIKGMKIGVYVADIILDRLPSQTVIS